MLDQLKRLLASRRAPLALALLAVVLTLPALAAGPMSDDYAHRLAFHPPAAFLRSGGPRGDWDLFRFQDGDRGFMAENKELGLWPWWTGDSFRLAFFRPIASLLHAFDYRLFPDAYALMHAESVAWYGLTVLCAGLYFRRMFGPTAVAGLAALLYAVDHAHATTVCWIANRHALLAGALGFLALIAHDRARREAWTKGRWLGPLAFALAMLAGENGLGALAYLVAHALFFERDALKARLWGLLPYGVVAGLWFAVYRGLGYGATGGAFYIDPVREPLDFLGALVSRLPALIAAQLALPPADTWILLPLDDKLRPLLFTLPIVLLLGLGLLLGLRRDRRAAYFATGMVLSLLPVCATWPSDRLLLFSGLGGFGLVASLLSASREGLSRLARPYVRVEAGLFVALHLVLSPLLLPLRVVQAGSSFHGYIQRGIESLPDPVFREENTLVVVNAPDTLVANYSMGGRFAQGARVPKALRLLSVVTEGTLAITRKDAHTLTITPSEGFIHDRLSKVFRSESARFSAGDRVVLGGMTVLVATVTDDGRPAHVEFQFEKSLEDPSLVWVLWDGVRFVPFKVPEVGEMQTLPAIDFFRSLNGS